MPALCLALICTRLPPQSLPPLPFPLTLIKSASLPWLPKIIGVGFGCHLLEMSPVSFYFLIPRLFTATCTNFLSFFPVSETGINLRWVQRRYASFHRTLIQSNLLANFVGEAFFNLLTNFFYVLLEQVAFNDIFVILGN